MAPDWALMAPTTPTEPLPTTPPNSPTVPLIRSTPDSGYSDGSDTDSTFTLDIAFEEAIFENGRTYHAYSAGHFQHESFALTLNPERIDATSPAEPIRRLYLSPLSKNAPLVLDVGTGTGIWAIDFGDKYPAAIVKGIDLSPIQPRWVPPNVHFVVDDVEEPWHRSGTFDFIHARMMIGALEDWPRFFRNCFENTTPEGWVEVSGPHLPFGCDNNSLLPTSSINQWSFCMLRASVILKRPIDIGPKFREMMHVAGFINIVEKVYKWPINPWPEDPRENKLGVYTKDNLDAGLEGLSMRFFTAGLEWTREELMILLAKVKAELKCTSIHAYVNIHVVYGQKPRSEQPF